MPEKKVWDQPLNERQSWIEADISVALSTQCRQLKVTRSVIYERKKRLQKETDKDELVLLRLLDEEYTRHPFYGSRRMKLYLGECGYSVNRKRVQRLMQQLGLVGMSPGPNTSKPHPQHKIYPYLLRGVDIIRPNQVWSTDITYIRLPRGFVYLVAIIDWYSRKVLSWRLSNTMDTGFCVDCLEEAIALYRPGFAIHQRRLYRRVAGQRHHDQYGWTRPGIGQHFCRAAVTNGEI